MGIFGRCGVIGWGGLEKRGGFWCDISMALLFICASKFMAMGSDR